MNKLKKTLLTLTAVFLLTSPVAALATGLDSIVTPLAGTATGTDLLGTVRIVANLLLTFVGLVAVIMIVVGGTRYILSQGDEDATVQARNTVLYSVVGIIIVVLSAVIINWILAAV